MSNRTPRFKRRPKAIGCIQLQERDLDIIKLVHDYRFIDSEQLELLIGCSHQVMLRRLKKLYHHGYLDRPISQVIFSNPLFGQRKMVYGPGDKGTDMLVERLGTEKGNIVYNQKKSVSERYIQHTLLISHFRACLTLALRDKPIKLLFWVRENVNKLKDHVYEDVSGRKRKLPIVPDGYFGIEDAGGKMYFFLEADRSTMSVTRFMNKMRAYWLWWRQGGAKRRFGIDNFRVLTLTISKQRRDNLVKATQQTDKTGAGSYMFWFAASDDIMLESPDTVLQNVWRTAKAGDGKSHSILE